MAVNKGDVVVRIQTSIPSSDDVQTVSSSGKVRRIEFELVLSNDLWTILLYQMSHKSSLVKPFFNIVGLIPPARSYWALGTGLEEIRLVSQFPVGGLAGTESFANQGDGAHQGVITCRAVLSKIEAVNVSHSRPCGVRIEIFRTNRYRRGIVLGSVEVETAYQGFRLGCVEGGIVPELSSTRQRGSTFGRLTQCSHRL